MPDDKKYEPKGVEGLYDYIKLATPYSNRDFAQSLDTFKNYLNESPENAQTIYQLIGKERSSDPYFSKTFGSTEPEFMQKVFKPLEPLRVLDERQSQYMSPYMSPIDGADVDDNQPEVPPTTEELSNWQETNWLKEIFGTAVEVAKGLAYITSRGSSPTTIGIPTTYEDIRMNQELTKAIEPITDPNLFEGQKNFREKEMNRFSEMILNHPEYKDPNSDFRKLIEQQPWIKSMVETKGKDAGYNFGGKVTVDLMNTFAYGMEETNRKVESEYLDAIKDPKLKSAVYLLESAARDYSGSWGEYIGRSAINVLAISLQLGKGYKAGGFGKGLAEAKYLPELKIVKDASKLKGLEAFDDITVKTMLKESGFTDDFKGISKVYGKRVDDVLTPKVMEVPEFGTRMKIRGKQLNSYGVQSIKASIPRINYEMNREATEMQLRGEDPSMGWYIARAGFKSWEAYMEAVGEYGGAMMSPYIDNALAKSIGNKVARGFTSHLVANPISEYLEERITDVFRTYLPNIIQGETMIPEGFLERSRDEFITFLPLALTGGGTELTQNYLHAKHVKVAEERKKAVTEKQKQDIEKINLAKQEAIKQLGAELNNILSDENLSPEDKAWLEKFKQEGLKNVVNSLASEEVGNELAMNIMKQYNEEIDKVEKDKVANGKAMQKEFYGVISNTRSPALQQAMNEIEKAITNKDFDIASSLINDALDVLKKGELKIKNSTVVIKHLTELQYFTSKRGDILTQLEKAKTFAYTNYAPQKTAKDPSIVHTPEMEKNLFISNNPAFSDELREHARAKYLQDIVAGKIEKGGFVEQVKNKELGTAGGELSKYSTLIKKEISQVEQFIPVKEYNEIADKIAKNEPLPEVSINKKNKGEQTAKLIEQFENDVKAYNTALTKVKDYKDEFSQLGAIGEGLAMLKLLDYKTGGEKENKRVLINWLLNHDITTEQIAKVAPNTVKTEFNEYGQQQVRKGSKEEIEKFPDYNKNEDDSPIPYFSTQLVQELGISATDEQQRPPELEDGDGWYATYEVTKDAQSLMQDYFKKLNFTRYEFEEKGGKTYLKMYVGSYDNYITGSSNFKDKFSKMIVKKGNASFVYKRLEQKLSTLEGKAKQETANTWQQNLGAYFEGTHTYNKRVGNEKENAELDKIKWSELKNKAFKVMHLLKGVQGTLAKEIGTIVNGKVDEKKNVDALRRAKRKLLDKLKYAEEYTSKLTEKKTAGKIPNEVNSTQVKKRPDSIKESNLESETKIRSFIDAYVKPIPAMSEKEEANFIKGMWKAYTNLTTDERKEIAKIVELRENNESFFANPKELANMNKSLKRSETESKSNISKAKPGDEELPPSTMSFAKKTETKVEPKITTKENDKVNQAADIFSKINVGKVDSEQIPKPTVKFELPNEDKGQNIGPRVFQFMGKTSFKLNEFLNKYTPKSDFYKLLKEAFLTELGDIQVLNSAEYGVDIVKGGMYIPNTVPAGSKQLAVGDVKGLKEKLDANGIDYSKGVIFYNPSASYSNADVEDVLFHEALHALTLDIIFEKYSAEIQALMDRVKDKINFNNPLITHAFTKPEEFIAILFNDADGGLKNQLATITTENGSNGLRDTIMIILKALGDRIKAILGMNLNTTTVLDEAIELFDRILIDVRNNPTTPAVEQNTVNQINLPAQLKQVILQKKYDPLKVETYIRQIAAKLADPKLNLETLNVMANAIIRGEVYNTEMIAALEVILDKMPALLVNKVKGEMNLEALLKTPLVIVEDNYRIESINDLLGYLHVKLTGVTVNEPAPNIAKTVNEEVAEEAEKATAIDSDLKQILPIADGLGASVNSENIDLLVDNMFTVKELGIALAKAWNNPELKSLYNAVKRGMTITKWMEFFDKSTPQGARMNQELLDIWEAKFKGKGIPYAEWKQKSLTRLYNNLDGKTYQPHINIHFETEKKTTKIKKIVSHLGRVFSDADGKKGNTLVGNSVLASYMPLFEKVFGKLEVQYVNGFVNEKTKPKKVVGIHKTKYKNKFATLANQMFDQGFIFFGTYSDKSEMPIFKFNKANLNMDLIHKIRMKYIELAKINPGEVTPAQEVAIVLENLIHEAYRNANMDKILSGNFTREDSKIIQTITDGKTGMYKPGAMFKIFKRVSFMLKRFTGHHEHLIEAYGITNDGSTSKIKGVFTKGKNLYFNHLTISTDTMKSEGQPKMIIVDEKPYDLSELLFNAFGTEITDGLSLAIIQPKGFFDFYRDYYGEYKEGSIKQWATHEYGEAPLYLKHSIQGVNPNDIIARWMNENNIAVLSFESANKLVDRSELFSLDQLQNKAVVAKEVNFKRMSHDMIKGEIQERVKAIKQLITSTFLSKYNGTIHNPESMMKTFRNILNKNAKNKLKKLFDYTEDYKEVFKFFQEKIKSPDGIMENGFSQAFQLFKDMKYSEFVANHTQILTHPYFSQYLEEYYLNQLESIFNVELPQGSALTIISDIGILAETRLNVAKSHLAELGLTYEEVFFPNGRLREGFCFVSENYAKKKNTKVGDKVVTTLVPMDSMLAINSSRVIGILNDSIVPQGSIIMNSEYVQSMIGRDFDIDVLYTLSFDSNLFTEREWDTFNSNITKTQQLTRESILANTKRIIDSDQTIKQKLAERLKIPFESFDIKTIAMAMKKETQQAVMEIMFGSNEAMLKAINPFDQSKFYSSEMYYKDIAGEINNRTYYTLNSTIGLAIKLEKLGIMLNPIHQDAELMHLKHQIMTNDRVDSPNRENIFNYTYNPVLDFLQDYVGYEQAKELSKRISEDQIGALQEIHQLLWGNLVMISKDYETSSIQRNYGNYRDRILKQQKIIKLIKAQEWDTLKALLKEDAKFSRSFYAGTGLASSGGVVETTLNFYLNKRRNDVENFLEAFLNPMIDDYIDGMAKGTFNLNDNLFIDLIENFPIEDINTPSINRGQYLEIENSIRRRLLELGGTSLIKPNGKEFSDDEINLGYYKTILLKRDVQKAKQGEYDGISPAQEQSNLEASINGIKGTPKPTLSFIREVVNVIYNFQSDAKLQMDITTIQGVARGAVISKFLREVLNHEEIFFTNNTYQELANGKRVVKDMRDEKGNIILKIEAISGGQLKFMYGDVAFSQKQITGEEATAGPYLKNLDEVRQLLFGRNTIFNSNLQNRKNLNGIFEFLKIDKSSIPENIDRLERVKIAVEYLNENLNAQNNDGKAIHTREDKDLFWATLLGGYSNKHVLNEFLGATDVKRYTYNFMAPAAIGEIYRPDYKQVLDRKNIDYEFNKYLLHIVGQVDPAFAEYYIEKWEQLTDTYSIYPPQKELLEMPDSDYDNEYLSTINHKMNVKRFISYYNGKHTKGFSTKSGISLYKEFFSALMDSPQSAFDFLKNYMSDLMLLESIKQTNPDGVARIMKDISKLTFNQFQQRYNNIEIDFDKLNYLEAELIKYGITDKDNKLQGSNIRRKLFGIFLSLNLIRDSYVSTPIAWLQPLQKVWYNMEFYAIKHGMKVYWPVDQDEILGEIPVLLSGSLGTIRRTPYSWNQIRAHIFEYINPTADNAFGLAEEAAYRMSHLNANIREMDYKLQSYLNNVAGIARKVYNDVIKNSKFQFSGDFEKYFKERVFTLAEGGIGNIEIKQHGTRFYYYHNGQRYILKELGETETAEKDILDVLYPEPTDLKEKAENDITRAAVFAALNIRTLLDYEVKGAIEAMYEHLSTMHNHALATGNRDLAAKINKMMFGYVRFYQAMAKRAGKYVPHFWDKNIYKQIYTERNIDKVIDDLKIKPENSAKTQAELITMAEAQIADELSFITENGFGIAFNPNAQMRTLPDFVEGYEKDIYKSINDYLRNFRTMVHKDLVKAEFYNYQIKARHIKENSYVVDVMKKWYALNGDSRELATKLQDKSDIKIGQEIEFLTVEPDYKGFPEEKVVWGRVQSTDENGVTLRDPETDSKMKYYTFDRIYVRNAYGQKTKNQVSRYKRYGVIEYRKQMMQEHQFAGRDGLKLLAGMAYHSTYYPFRILNYLTTMSNLGFIAQLPAYLVNKIGGTILNLDGAWIRNRNYIKRGYEDFAKLEPELYHSIKVKLGLEMPEFLIDNATYTDLNLTQIGINEDWWRTTKSMANDFWEATKEKIFNMNSSGNAAYRARTNALIEQYKATPTIELRGKILQSTMQFLKERKDAKLISQYEYEKLVARYEKVYLAKEKSLPVDPILYDKAEPGREFADLVKFLKYKYDSSYAGLKFFSAPEKTLRIQAFFIGYYQAQEILSMADKGLAIEYGLANVAKKQKFYGTSDRQFGSATLMGKVMFKFSHFVWDELVRERKKVANAVKTAIVYSGHNPLASDITDTFTDGKRKVAISTPKYYFTALAVASFLSNLAQYFPGLDNPLSPIKNFQYKLYKFLLQMLDDITQGKNGFERWEKLDYEEVDFIREMMASVGFGWGGTVPINTALWTTQDEKTRGRFPILPRWVGMVNNASDAIDASFGDDYGKNTFQKTIEANRSRNKVERALTGMNIWGNPISDKKEIYSLEGLEKLDYLLTKPARLIPEMERIGKILKQL